MSLVSSGGAVRVGLIGCGGVARRAHVPGLRRAGAEVIRFASRELADAEAAAEQSGSPDAMSTDDWHHIVDSPHVDAVDICTPSHLHAEMALAAIESGKHVLVESPMATTTADADALLRAAARKGVMLVPAHGVRFIAPYAAVIDATRSGLIGTVTGVRAGFGHRGPDRQSPDAKWYLEKRRAGGGALIDLGVCLVDVLRAALAAEVTAVAAMTSGERGDVEEQAQALLHFASGAVASIHTSWLATPGPDNQLTIFGTEGTLHLDQRTAPRVIRPDGSQERLPLAEDPPGVEAAFVDALRGAATTINAADGRAAVAVIEAAYRAAESGGTVEVTSPTW